MSEAFATKVLRFKQLGFKTVVPRATIDAAKFVSFPSGFHGTNPSLVAIDGGYLISVRGVNHIYVRRLIGDALAFTMGDDYENIHRFAVLDSELNFVRALPGLDSAFDGFEDVRLFRFDDKIMAVANANDPDAGPNARSIVLLTIDPDFASGAARRIPSPYGFRQEKNWAPFVLDGELHFVYSFEPLVVLRYDPATGRATFAGPRFANVPVATLRFLVAGSSAGMPVEGGFLFATHRRIFSLPLRHRYYVHRLCYLDAKTLELRCGPYFSLGKRTIQFINGLAVRDDEFVVSFGVMDATANFARIARAEIFT